MIKLELILKNSKNKNNVILIYAFLYYLIFFNILILFNSYYLEKICLYLYIIFSLSFSLTSLFLIFSMSETSPFEIEKKKETLFWNARTHDPITHGRTSWKTGRIHYLFPFNVPWIGKETSLCQTGMHVRRTVIMPFQK